MRVESSSPTIASVRHRLARRALDGVDLDDPIDGLLIDVGVVGVRRRAPGDPMTMKERRG